MLWEGSLQLREGDTKGIKKPGEKQRETTFVVLERGRNIEVMALKNLAVACFYLYVTITWF